MKNVLITGITGFAGSFLAEYLVSLGNYTISGTFHNEASLKNVEHIKEHLDLVKVDLTDKDAVDVLIAQKKPDMVFHLAAMASVGASFKDPVNTIHTNVDAEVFLLESLKTHELVNTRVLLISSAEIYGYVRPDDLPIDENTPMRPANPYSVSKIVQDFLGCQYFISYKMPIIRARPFNHIGPRQTTGFVAADFAQQVALIEKGLQEPVIKVGNLEAKRDFTDVRDMVRAYVMLLENGAPGEAYNIGSGVSHKIEEIVDILVRLSNTQITVEVDPEKLRPSDVSEIVSDNSKLNAVIDWRPEINLEETLKDTLDYWRNIV